MRDRTSQVSSIASRNRSAAAGLFFAIHAKQASISLSALGEVSYCELDYNRFVPGVKDRWRERPGDGAGLLYDLGPHPFGNNVRQKAEKRVEQLFIHRISFPSLPRSYLVIALLVVRQLVEPERFDPSLG
jgi:hypothetical protein